MNLPNELYAIAFIVAGLAMLGLTWKKRSQGVKEDWFTLFGKIIVGFFMIGFGVLVWAVKQTS